jgi:hypothetical protein
MYTYKQITLMKKQFKTTKALLIVLFLAFSSIYNTHAGQKPKIQVCYTTTGNQTYVSSYGNTCVAGTLTCDANPCKVADAGLEP